MNTHPTVPPLNPIPLEQTLLFKQISYNLITGLPLSNGFDALSIVMLSCTVHHFAITHKKVSKAAMERNDDEPAHLVLCIPLYFCFSIILSPSLIHHHAPHWCHLPCDMCEPSWLLVHDTHLHWTHYQSLHWPGFMYLMDIWPMIYIAAFPYLVTQHAPQWHNQSWVIMLCGQGLVVVLLQMILVLNSLIIIYI